MTPPLDTGTDPRPANHTEAPATPGQDARALRDFLETHHDRPLRNGRRWTDILESALAAARDEGRREAVRQIRERLNEAAIDMRGWQDRTYRYIPEYKAATILDDVARHGRSSDPEPAPRYPIRIAGDGGTDTDDWTCSCGLTRPVTGSYGCADCGDGRPDSWERVGAVPALQATGDPDIDIIEAAFDDADRAGATGEEERHE